jgi:glycosyltransferase involved in cell wall biosynthesis
MKHFMFTSNYLPFVGGLEYYVHDLSASLSSIWGDEVHVVCFDEVESFEENYGSYVVHRIKRLAIVAGVFAVPHPVSAYRVIKRLMSQMSFDSVVWTHTRFFISTIMGLLIAKRAGLRLIHVEHGSGFVYHSKWIVRLVSRLWDETLSRIVFRLSDDIVATSIMGSDFIRKIGGRNAKVVPAGVDPENFKPQCPHYNMPAQPVVLCAGRLQPGKGVENLLIAIMAVELQHLRLVVVGDGPLRGKLEKYVNDNNLKSRVEFVGEISRDALIKYYQRASLFVNPSYSEGGPLTVIEALMCGLPVVSTPVGNCSLYIEASGGVGYITAGMSPMDIKLSIIKALSKWIVQDRMQCHLRVSKRFSWMAAAAELRSIVVK